jgi:hypothetical protein
MSRDIMDVIRHFGLDVANRMMFAHLALWQAEQNAARRIHGVELDVERNINQGLAHPDDVEVGLAIES